MKAVSGGWVIQDGQWHHEGMPHVTKIIRKPMRPLGASTEASTTRSFTSMRLQVRTRLYSILDLARRTNCSVRELAYENNTEFLLEIGFRV